MGSQYGLLLASGARRYCRSAIRGSSLPSFSRIRVWSSVLSPFLSFSLPLSLLYPWCASLVHHRRNGGAQGTRRREIGRMGILLLESTPYWTSIGILKEEHSENCPKKLSEILLSEKP